MSYQYRRCVGMMILNNENKIFVSKQSQYSEGDKSSFTDQILYKPFRINLILKGFTWNTVKKRKAIIHISQIKSLHCKKLESF